MLTILTPTYNRENTLKNAYLSLLDQTNKDFEWLIIDDGSKDNTKKLVKEFIKENKINITYHYKENGGKHTALNEGVKKARGTYILILDSDDTLTKNAVHLVLTSWQKYENNQKIAALSFLKVFPNNEVIGKKYHQKEVRSNHIDFRYNQNLLGDMCEVFKKDILKKYPFPTFNHERFLSEAIIWNKIALDYDTVYINKPIYIADYLQDGLSKSFFKLVYHNPLGAKANANMFLIKRFKLKIRLKNAILYDGYALTAKLKVKDFIKESNNKLLTILALPAGYLYKHFLAYQAKKK